jgi:predicted  nucleic acid-binding Zn-ribbon protein
LKNELEESKAKAKDLLEELLAQKNAAGDSGKALFDATHKIKDLETQLKELGLNSSKTESSLNQRIKTLELDKNDLKRQFEKAQNDYKMLKAEFESFKISSCDNDD